MYGPLEGEHRPRLACPSLRPHRLRQPAPRRDDDPGHGRRRGRADPARDRAGHRRVGPAGRVPRSRRDGPRRRGPRDPRGDRSARRAGRDRRAVLAPRGDGRRGRLRGAGSSAVARPRPSRPPRSRSSRPSRSHGPGSPSRRPTSRCVDWLARRRPDLVAGPQPAWAAGPADRPADQAVGLGLAEALAARRGR